MQIQPEEDSPSPFSSTAPYPSHVHDTQSREQPSINMPDHNDYVSPIMAGSKTRHNLHQQPPYPLHDDDHEIDLYGGNSEFFSLPTAKDSHQLQLPLPLIETYDSDQDLPVIEPDSHVPNPHDDDVQSNVSYAVIPNRRWLADSIESNRILGFAPGPRRSQTELVVPLHVPVPAPSASMSEHNSLTVVRVPTIRSDMYQPALGGLHRIPAVQRKDSKCDRVKRFMAGLNPFHHRRAFGRRTK